MPREDLLDLLHSLFQKADVDGSGALSRSEFMACLKEADLGLTRKEINAAMSEVDENDDGLVTYEEFVPICLDVLVQIVSEDMKNSMLPTKEVEFAEFFADLFQSADVTETGKLTVGEIKELILKADLGLTRVQLVIILSQAEEDEDGKVDYIAFASAISGTLAALWGQRKMAADDVLKVRSNAEYQYILGKDAEEIEGALMAQFANADKDNLGRLDRDVVRKCIVDTEIGFDDRQIQTLLSLTSADETGFLYYDEIIKYGFKCLQYLKEQELLSS